MKNYWKPIIVITLLLTCVTAMSADLIKTKCYKTESPVGEVCIFEDRRALGVNAAKYQDTCEEEAKLPVKDLKSPELQVTDSEGKETDRKKIAPLTSLNLLKIKVNGAKTFFTSYQSLGCGSFSGTGYSPFWVVNGKINFLSIGNKEITFMNTLKRGWKPVSDGFLEARSELSEKRGNPKIDDGFITIYTRYQLLNNSWVTKEKLKFGLTEFETELVEKDFPERAKN
jgi:hypothetical protein